MIGIARLMGAVALAALALTDVTQAADRIRIGEGPFITGGAFFVAREKGYFAKMGIEIETKSFIDGALAVPSMISGELDMSFMTPNASLFNSVAKGAPLVIVLDRGSNKKGYAYTIVNVSQALADAGLKSLADFAKLKGKKISLVYHDSPYGKEPIPALEARAAKDGFTFKAIPVTHPGVEQKSQWLAIRQDRPDYVLLWGWGVMNSTAIKEAAAVGYPRDKMIGVWWSGAEPDVKDVGEGAKGYSAATRPGTAWNRSASSP